jgi:putative chitinase
MITINQLQKICPTTPIAMLQSFLQPINTFSSAYGITTPLRTQHFMAQIAVESQYLSRLSENLNYDAKGLLKVFSSHFTIDTANQYQHNPGMIANKVYADRYGNGNEDSGDGWKYRGSGALMTTFKDNFIETGRAIGLDLANNPDLLRQPMAAIKSAMYFWQSRGLNSFADADNIVKITEIVNGGQNGLQDRVNALKLCKNYIT